MTTSQPFTATKNEAARRRSPLIADLGLEGQLHHATYLPTLSVHMLTWLYYFDSNLPLSAILVLLEVGRRQAEGNNLTAAELAVRLNMAPQVVGRALKRLSVGAGVDQSGNSKATICLADNAPTGARGRPSKVVQLTPRGADLLDGFLYRHRQALEKAKPD